MSHSFTWVTSWSNLAWDSHCASKLKGVSFLRSIVNCCESVESSVWHKLLTTCHTTLCPCWNHFTKDHSVLTSAELTAVLFAICRSLNNRVILGCVVIILHESLERVVGHLYIVLLLFCVKEELLISLVRISSFIAASALMVFNTLKSRTSNRG